jgi:hypothetical protein
VNILPKGIADLFDERIFFSGCLGVEDPVEFLLIFGMPQDVILAI